MLNAKIFHMRWLLLCGLLWCLALQTAAQNTDFTPMLHGTIRGKYEYEPQISSNRFEVRNARVSVVGNVALPSLSYMAEIDLSDEGVIKMLDAFVRYDLMSLIDSGGAATRRGQSLEFTIGQMRVPFTIDAKRSPHNQYFANRSFIAKQVGNVRDVGAMLGYHFGLQRPVVLEAGLFNGSGLTNQKVWHKSLNYSAKAQWFFSKGWNLTLSGQTTKPDSVRIYTYDAGMYYENERWHIEGEYLYKRYANHIFPDVHAVDAFVVCALPLKRVFSKMLLLGRYDYMTNYSDGLTLSAGRLSPTDYARQRLTGGLSLCAGGKFQSEIRLNYEKYFYHASGVPKEGERDKLVTELMIHF